jgi:hypothetical protein
MNIFGAFTFGSLIKTFLPGFVWLISILICAVLLLDAGTDIWTQVKAKDQAALVLAIPASILLGLLSNVAVFMGLNNWLVRDPMDKKHAALSGLLEELKRRVRQQCWGELAPQDGLDREQFFESIDPEYIALERIGVEKLAYVREQYWYHLEFQLNLMLSLVVLFTLLAAISLAHAESCLEFLSIAFWTAIGYLFCGGLLIAARKNYCRHIAKMASLMTALLAPPPKPAEAPPAQAPQTTAPAPQTPLA